MDITHPRASTTLKLVGVMSDRHVEIMRDDLSEIYYDAGRDDVEYLFGDRITAIADDGAVTFEHAASAKFDVVVGADGLHSGVRRFVFGDDVPERFLGGYLAVVSVPKSLARDGEMNGFYEPSESPWSTPPSTSTMPVPCSSSARSGLWTTTIAT